MYAIFIRFKKLLKQFFLKLHEPGRTVLILTGLKSDVTMVSLPYVIHNVLGCLGQRENAQ